MLQNNHISFLEMWILSYDLPIFIPVCDFLRSYKNGGVTIKQTNIFINQFTTYFRPDYAIIRWTVCVLVTPTFLCVSTTSMMKYYKILLSF
jgi:hypothetical protein